MPVDSRIYKTSLGPSLSTIFHFVSASFSYKNENQIHLNGRVEDGFALRNIERNKIWHQRHKTRMRMRGDIKSPLQVSKCSLSIVVVCVCADNHTRWQIIPCRLRERRQMARIAQHKGNKWMLHGSERSNLCWACCFSLYEPLKTK